MPAKPCTQMMAIMITAMVVATSATVRRIEVNQLPSACGLEK